MKRAPHDEETATISDHLRSSRGLGSTEAYERSSPSRSSAAMSSSPRVTHASIPSPLRVSIRNTQVLIDRQVDPAWAVTHTGLPHPKSAS
ncbi:hypothetical protein NL676_027480 [Syzygium grande]|nr:hypothetical protein NL676_027480 [Syzygium grande]